MRTMITTTKVAAYLTAHHFLNVTFRTSYVSVYSPSGRYAEFSNTPSISGFLLGGEDGNAIRVPCVPGMDAALVARIIAGWIDGVE